MSKRTHRTALLIGMELSAWMLLDMTLCRWTCDVKMEMYIERNNDGKKSQSRKLGYTLPVLTGRNLPKRVTISMEKLHAHLKRGDKSAEMLFHLDTLIIN